MTREQAALGTRVKTLVSWVGVPTGTTGVIDEDYGTGVMVRWDLSFNWKPLRDGFANEELHYLEVI